MKAGYEVVNGAIDMMQTHEAWDYGSSVGFQAAAASNSFPKQVVTNLERNELSEWVEHVTRQLIDDMPDTPSDHSLQTDTAMVCNEDSSNNNVVPSLLTSDSRPRKALKRSHFDGAYSIHEEELQWSNIELGNQIRINENGASNGRGLSRIDEHGLNLISLLFECAVAISVDNLGEAHRMLLELTQMASPYGPSCAERVVAYFAKAMASRVINSWLGICSPLINHKTVHSAFQVFNNVSPFIKFAHFISNQEILEAFQRRDRVHIIDLDIMQGLQWPALFHILATRMEGPPHIRMTGMGTSMDLLVETGKQLSNFAKRLGLSFEFHPIAKKFGEIDVSMVPLRRGETLAVHWLQHSLYDATGPDWKTMRLLEELSPRIMTLVEQDISHGGSFLDRFVGSLHYYSTLFDSLGAFLPCDDSSRHRVEHCLLYREINNVLAIGGPARSGEDKLRHWRSELAARSTSFMQVPMSGNSMAQAQLILNMFPPAHGYSLAQGEGALRLGWKDTSLFTASAWTSLASR
ncbi:protein SCARECROW [Ricinus communis]|uniref:DELLA protein GAIP, putative n=1 Tax=Ricinus communis TaxID=3988 RepID=B9SV25_RICCO|nr:protein SCARECROW [Ricinus communis]EEF32545.1 DELLA protein GAIP, putative [Ricinus communis]|eukprot:XP_002529844.1 protein SCARECROW [Ricinus communis]